MIPEQVQRKPNGVTEVSTVHIHTYCIDTHECEHIQIQYNIQIQIPVQHVIISGATPAQHVIISGATPVHYVIISSTTPAQHVIISSDTPVHYVFISSATPVQHVFISSATPPDHGSFCVYS